MLKLASQVWPCESSGQFVTVITRDNIVNHFCFKGGGWKEGVTCLPCEVG